MPPYPRFLSLFTTTLLLSLIIHLPIETPLKMNAAIAQPASSADQKVEAERLFEQGKQQFSHSEYQEAIQSWQQALELYRKIGDRNEVANLQLHLGSTYSKLRQYYQALNSFKESLGIFRDVKNRQSEANAQMNIGVAYNNLGRSHHALEFFQRSLNIFRGINDSQGEAVTLNYLGEAYKNLGQDNHALDYFQRSLNISQSIGDRNGEASSLNNLGEAYRHQGQYPKAIEYFEQALAIFQAIGDRNGEARSTGNLGLAYFSQGQYPKAIEYEKQSLAIFQDIGDRQGEANILNHLGETYNILGTYQDALNFIQQALSIFQNIGDRRGEADALNNLGEVYIKSGKVQEANSALEQSLSLSKEIGNLNGETSSLNNRGNAYNNRGRFRHAVEFLQRALLQSQESGNPEEEGISLLNLGLVYKNLGQVRESSEFYERSLAIFQATGDREEESLTLANIGDLLANQNQPKAAIVFLKQSVNVREAIRQDNRSLSQELQQSYTDTIAGTYRQLSELLLAQGRILEAQQVLELLKLQELRDFTGVRAKVTANGIELTPSEQAVITKHNSLIAFGQQVNQCQRTQCSQLSTLFDQRDQLTQQFNKTLQTFEAEMRTRLAQDRAALDTQDFNRSAREIVEAQSGTVMIYTVVLDNKLWLLWATAGGVVDNVEVPVTRQQLGETVLQFRQLLSTPNSDITQVQATAKQLYDWLIAPIASELQKNHIQHLVFSLDRVTRYIPMTALFDGQHYLIENYTVSTVLSADLTHVSEHLPPGTDQTSVLALGLSNAVPPDFPSLPNVPAELNAIVRSSDDPQGIYSGLKFLNGQFDDRTLRNNLPGHQIVHIATHGVFVPGRQDQSYLVLGNGQHMSISSIQELQDLEGVKLVVLSACQTALGEPDQDGLEIAGIAYYFLNGGANTVMASLWTVNDTSGSFASLIAITRSLSTALSDQSAHQ